MDNPFDGKRVFTTGRLGMYEGEPVISRLARLGAVLQGTLDESTEWLIVGVRPSRRILDKYDKLLLADSPCVLIERDRLDEMLWKYKEYHYTEDDRKRERREKRRYVSLIAETCGYNKHFLEGIPNTGDEVFTIEKLYALDLDNMKSAFKDIVAWRKEQQKEKERQKLRRDILIGLGATGVFLLLMLVFGYTNVMGVLMAIGLMYWIITIFGWLLLPIIGSLFGFGVSNHRLMRGIKFGWRHRK